MSFPVAPENDHRHTLGPGEHEAFYFIFSSPDGKTYGFVRTLFDQETVLELIALRVGQRTWVHQHRARHSDPPSPANDASGPGLSLLCLEPWQTWRCRFHDAVHGSGNAVEANLELTFAASGPPAQYRFGPYQQVQQDGRFTGHLRVGTEAWGDDWPGYRDHSWGQRPMGAAAGWTVASVPGHLYVAVVETPEGPFCFGRFNASDGRLLPARMARVALEGEEWRVEDPEIGTGVWLAQRLASPLVAHLGPAGHEEIRDTSRPGDLLRDEIGPVQFTSPWGETFLGFLEQARRPE